MRAPQKTVYPCRVSVITGDILAKLGMAKLTLQQIVAEHGVFGQCAADGQQRGGIVNALTHKGPAAEYILIEFLCGGAVAVCPAHAAKQRLRVRFHMHGQRLHARLEDARTAFLQGMQHRAQQTLSRPGGQKGVRIQGDYIGVAALQAFGRRAGIGQGIRARFPAQQAAQHFQRAALALPADIAALGAVSAAGTVQAVKARAVALIERTNAAR